MVDWFSVKKDFTNDSVPMDVFFTIMQLWEVVCQTNIKRTLELLENMEITDPHQVFERKAKDLSEEWIWKNQRAYNKIIFFILSSQEQLLSSVKMLLEKEVNKKRKTKKSVFAHELLKHILNGDSWR